MFLEATDPDFLDRINDSPHEPKKLVPAAVVDGVTIPSITAAGHQKKRLMC